MPTVRHQLPRGRFVELSDYQLATLLDQDLPEPSTEDFWWRLDGDTLVDAAWRANEAALLGLFVAERPGQRPDAWWRCSAPRQPVGRWSGWWFDGKLPEPRRRLGGTGSAIWEAGLAYVPHYCRGIPTIWLTVEHEQLSAPAFDPADPPLFEAEASYLERHGLFLPGERRRLRKADWAPEAAEL